NIVLGGISGKVIDKKTQEALPYVTVTIENEIGEILTGGITDDKGFFDLSSIPVGVVKVKIQYIGFVSYLKELTIEKNNESVDLGIIALEEDIASLDEVVVVAEQSTMVQKIDRRVINVGKDLTTAGATA